MRYLQDAVSLAALVRAGEAKAADVVREHLDRIAELDGRVGAFVAVRREDALAEAASTTDGPLAGVPVAIKDNVDVAGVPTRLGTTASFEPAAADEEVVRRLRAAGAVVVGKAAMSELGIWGTTELPGRVTRNPWDLSRTSGGSSGGSAAAVAAGMVPLALGNDALGSIRGPAACCGLFGIKPGAGLVPHAFRGWFSLVEHGPLATTVDDAALMLSVLADRPDLARPAMPGPLRVAISTAAPLAGVRVDKQLARAVEETGRALAGAGHDVRRADPPYSLRTAAAIMARYMAAPLETAEGVDPAALTRRTRGHLRLGRFVARRNWIRESQRDAWRAALARFFDGVDVLVTPTLAQIPPRAGRWTHRSALRNTNSAARWAPFPPAWNFAGYPAASVPAGMHDAGVPVGVQLIAPEGGEALLLSVAKQLEALRPWPRRAQVS